MNKLKKVFILFTLFLFFSGCGYTPIFSKNEVNFSIENIKFLGDNVVNKKINQALFGYKNKSDKEKKISLILRSSKNIAVASKNSKGEAQTYKVTLQVNKICSATPTLQNIKTRKMYRESFFIFYSFLTSSHCPNFKMLML